MLVHFPGGGNRFDGTAGAVIGRALTFGRRRLIDGTWQPRSGPINHGR